MKALKEKRISLRSLWRRGLVILSLFALVFASCGDSSSSSDGGGSSGGRRVTSIVFLSSEYDSEAKEYLIPGFQYMGQEVDLTGVYVEVYYADKSTPDIVKYEDAKDNFAKYPRVATGIWDVSKIDEDKNPSGFIGMKNVKVFYDAGNGYIWSEVMPFKYRPIGIKREATNSVVPDPITNQGDPDVNSKDEVFSGGVHLTGVLKKDSVYVDDEDFDFDGLSLWADYLDGIQRPLKFENVIWEVLPDYNRDEKGLPRDTDDDQTYRGYLYITVGADVSTHDDGTTWAGGNGTPAKWDGGITVRRALNNVYTVYDEATGIEWVETPQLDPFFFWMPNTPEAWQERLEKANAAIRVNYRGTKNPKTFYIKDLKEQELIYWNKNPQPTSKDNGIKPIDYTYNAKRAPDGYKPNPNPQIEVYYRGARKELAIDVYAIYRGLDVVNNQGEDISFEDKEPGYDNDVTTPIGTDEKDFAKLVTVTARYRAYNDSSKEEGYLLKLWPSTLDEFGIAQPVKDKLKEDDEFNGVFGVQNIVGDDPLRYWRAGPYYTTDFYEAQKRASEKFNEAKPKTVKETVVIKYLVDSTDTENVLKVDRPFDTPYPLFGERIDVTKKGFDNPVNKKAKITWTK